jgi:hypothetical protein
MAVKLKFQGESVQGGHEGAVEAIYVITGADSKEAAMVQLYTSPDVPESITHNVYGGTLYREPVPDIDEVSQEDGVWWGTVRWSPPDDFDGELTPAEPIVSFNTVGGSGRITQSKETVASATVDEILGAGYNTHGAIGITSDGTVEGTDIVIPIYEWEETHEVPAATVTAEYRRTLYRLTGTVNSEAFRDMAIGEALFLGASGSRRGRGNARPWEINFRFAGSANAENITIDGVGPVKKDGWDYLWVKYVPYFDQQTGTTLTVKVGGVFVERVYNRAAWSFMPDQGSTIGGMPPGFGPLG